MADDDPASLPGQCRYCRAVGSFDGCPMRGIPGRCRRVVLGGRPEDYRHPRRERQRDERTRR
ncbi:hypothetical protein [Streptomyces blastmyceticus]|uniref:Uncharacterized protein n=1 Tax=Streptomyces blastmyceticus TaxID=68180 RepID=A0ABN0XYQ6_9ACTN